MKKILGIIIFLSSIPVLFAPRAWAISDVCEDMCFPRQNEGLFSCQRQCKDDDKTLARLPIGLYFLNAKIQKQLEPPPVEQVTLTPEQPKPGDTLKVTVRLKKIKDEALPPNVFVYYSYDDARTWHGAPGTFNPVDKTFDIFFPAPKEAVRLAWFVRAVSEDNDAYIELPCNVAHFPFVANECLIPLAEEDSYAGTEDFVMDPSLDITKAKIGQDETNYFFSYETADIIKPGINPPQLMFTYVVAVVDPAEWTKVDPMNNVVFLVYSPLLYTPAKCALIKKRGSVWTPDTNAIDCKADGNKIMFRARKKLLAGKRSDKIQVYFGSLVLLEDSAGVIKDYTGLTTVNVGPPRVIEFKPAQ